ncbi:MAG: autoinducer-2 kinase [Solirubrobacteraceae bacterium]
MSGEQLLAIDAGTGSCRAVLFAADGEQLAVGQREYSHRAEPGVPGSQVFDTARNWKLIAECVREALSAAEADADAVKAVSATSMREGMVLYDARGDELWACPNVDGRAGAETAELVQSGAAQEIYEHSGDWVSITAPPRFMWIARHRPELFASVAHVGMLGDWILRRPCGAFVTDPSLGSSSGMFELGQRDWSDRILEICGLDRSIFPAVVDPGTVVGQVTAEAALQTGLRAGTAVVAGGADTQLALLGLGVTEPGRFTLVGGSFWQHAVALDEPLIDPLGRLRTLCHTAPGRWMIEGIGFYCGMVMRWFRDAFCEIERDQAGREGIDVYKLLERKAAERPPGAHGVFGIFSNVMQANRWVHASPGFLGFDVDHPERAGRIECFRAIEESAAYVSRGHLRIVEQIAGVPIDEVVMCGGAAKGTLWPQIIADTLGLPVQIPVVKESTALGAAIYAGVGAGLFSDPAAVARQISRVERTFTPRAEAVAAYDGLYEQWSELYRRSLELSEAGLVRPLWRAAGT